MEKLEYYLLIYRHRIKAIAWIILYFWIAQPILLNFFSIDFSDENYAMRFNFIWILLLPLGLSVLILLKKSIKLVNKIHTAFMVFLFTYFIMFFLTFFSQFFYWRISEPIYFNIHNNNTIRNRVFNHGAWDSSPTYILVETTPVTKYFYLYKEISQNDIDTTIWKRVKSDY